MTTPRAAGIPSLSRRAKILIAVAVGLLALLLIGPRVVDVYTAFLWFGSLGHAGVLRTVLLSRLGLFVVTGLILALFTFAGMWLAYRVRPAFLPSPTDDPVVRYRAVVTSRLKTFAIVPAVLIGLIAGIFGQASWQQVLLFFNRQPFGSTDAEFGMDIGFYAFTLPFIEFVLGFLFAGLILMFLANLVSHYVFGGIRLAGRDGSLSRGARIQLAAIAGVFLLTKAVAYWFDRYALVYSNRSPMFTGASYTDIHAMLPAKAILTGIAIICAAAFFFGIVLRDLRVPAIATVLMLFSSLVVGVGWPTAIQTFSVGPNAEKELPYIARNIAATRDAYGLANAKYETADAKVTPEALQTLTAKDAPSLQNVRLLDPNVVSPAFANFGKLKDYYKLTDQLSVDRYDVGGNLTNVLLAPIELNPAETPADWTSRHMVYTHGNGLLTAPAGQVDQVVSESGKDAVANANAGGQPVITRNGVAGKATVSQPRIYFGEIIGSDPDFYSVVGSTGDARELDSDSERSRYEGAGGVGIGNWFTRLAYAIKFTERNILLNGNIGPDSKIIYQRDPRDRVKQLAPFLTVDTKTYPMVDSRTGRILWVVDGYTTLPKYPYAQQTSLSDATGSRQQAVAGQQAQRRQVDEKVGYIRNSVKATVDAYDGSVHLYQVDEKDPVLNAWKSVFPGVIEPKSAVPAEVAQQFRYPQDLFEVQRFLLQKYHTTDANTFRQQNDLWQIAAAPKETPDKDGLQSPYYSVAASPGGGAARFQLSSILQQKDQAYMAAYVSVASEGEDAGRLVVRDVRGLPGKQTPGPVWAVDLINGSQSVANDKANIQALSPKFGNLQAIGLANGGLTYVWPMYAQGQGGSTAPKLIKVLSLNPVTGGAGYRTTVAASLSDAGYRGVDAALATAATGVSGPTQGQTVPAPTQPGNGAQPPATATTPGGDTPDVQAAVKAVGDAWGSVLSAQRSGDQVAVGQAMKQLGDAITKLQDAESKARGGK
ncbi:UPF0182 family protein [Tsukamurella pseudospumae]|uniref:Uncharacterized protein n=1 Tax=Tsukamurella pseudospumae TaxID=239498 RepID=A0A138ABK3_9ACTN|nr:UPF0182 family protein [Tsukamurella pseudospumae]KXP07823.1 hypothetical protein AXK60_09360 [Tsukamurella pseudospumae]